MSSSTFSRLLQALDPRAEVRFREFEQICKWFLTNDPLYQRQIRRVWLWDEWPGRWGADAGIDLVVEDRAGGQWASRRSASVHGRTRLRRFVRCSRDSLQAIEAS